MRANYAQINRVTSIYLKRAKKRQPHFQNFSHISASHHLLFIYPCEEWILLLSKIGRESVFILWAYNTVMRRQRFRTGGDFHNNLRITITRAIFCTIFYKESNMIHDERSNDDSLARLVLHPIVSPV